MASTLAFAPTAEDLDDLHFDAPILISAPANTPGHRATAGPDERNRPALRPEGKFAVADDPGHMAPSACHAGCSDAFNTSFSTVR